ncbi:MAG: hypothetical protein ACI311_02750 [Bacilli bacterium]
MEKYLILLKSKQIVDNDVISQNYEGEMYVSNLNVLTYEISYKDTNNIPSSIVVLFEEDELLSVKIISNDIFGVFKLALNEKTEGMYFVGKSKLPLNFFLKKIERNDVDFVIEYDIYSHEKILSCNTLEIEVKKC